MGVLRSRHSQQGLVSQGVYLADQPGLVLKGRSLEFFSLTLRLGDTQPSGLAAVRDRLQAVVNRARVRHDEATLHLYYLDCEGNALLTLAQSGEARMQDQAPVLEWDGRPHPTTPVDDIVWMRRYEAVGREGLQARGFEEKRDLFGALEKFLNAHQLGWGGQFFARDAQARQEIFQSYEPFRSGLLRVAYWIEDLRFTQRLVLRVGADGQIAFRSVVQSLDRVTLDEVLSWS